MKTITFYSYKGGVGRTMALANIAVLLSKRGKKVLVVDWDLEAPGLHEYFNNNEYEKVPANKKGGLMGLLKTAKTDKAKSCWRDYLSKVIFPLVYVILYKIY